MVHNAYSVCIDQDKLSYILSDIGTVLHIVIFDIKSKSITKYEMSGVVNGDVMESIIIHSKLHIICD